LAKFLIWKQTLACKRSSCRHKRELNKELSQSIGCFAIIRTNLPIPELFKASPSLQSSNEFFVPVWDQGHLFCSVIVVDNCHQLTFLPSLLYRIENTEQFSALGRRRKQRCHVFRNGEVVSHACWLSLFIPPTLAARSSPLQWALANCVRINALLSAN
jgi:hypothetical protein